MPTYEYACPDCGHKFEIKQKFTDDSLKRCPNCQRRHLYRVVSQVAISFKGSGWYITDSQSSSDKHTLTHKQKDEGVESGGDVKTEVKAETTAETKTETKTDVKAEAKTETKSETKTVESTKSDSKNHKTQKT
jgi:putative FmdB family regulatory protein